MFFTHAPLLNMLLALLVTLALMLGLALIVRRLNPAILTPGNNRRLRKVESLSLTPHHAVHIIEVNGTTRVLLTGPQRTNELFPLEDKP